MRIDDKLNSAHQGLTQESRTLRDLTNTKTRLDSRNCKLLKAAKRPFANQIPLLPQGFRLPSSPESVVSENSASPTEPATCAETMKPKASKSSDSSMGAESQTGDAGKKTNDSLTYRYYLDLYVMSDELTRVQTFNKHANSIRTGKFNASDPFFDADATVFDSDNNSSGDPSDMSEDASTEGPKGGGRRNLQELRLERQLRS